MGVIVAFFCHDGWEEARMLMLVKQLIIEYQAYLLSEWFTMNSFLQSILWQQDFRIALVTSGLRYLLLDRENKGAFGFLGR